MKKIILLSLLLLLTLFLTFLIFIPLALSDIMGITAASGLHLEPGVLLKFIPRLVLFGLPLCSLITLHIVWFTFHQRHNRKSSLYWIPLLLVSVSVTTVFLLIPEGYLLTPVPEIIQAAETISSGADYEYEILAETFQAPVWVESVKAFNELVLGQVIEFRGQGAVYLLLFCAGYFICCSSFWKWGAVTSWSFLNFMFSLTFFFLNLRVVRWFIEKGVAFVVNLVPSLDGNNLVLPLLLFLFGLIQALLFIPAGMGRRQVDAD